MPPARLETTTAISEVLGLIDVLGLLLRIRVNPRATRRTQANSSDVKKQRKYLIDIEKLQSKHRRALASSPRSSSDLIRRKPAYLGRRDSINVQSGGRLIAAFPLIKYRVLYHISATKVKWRFGEYPSPMKCPGWSQPISPAFRTWLPARCVGHLPLPRRGGIRVRTQGVPACPVGLASFPSAARQDPQGEQGTDRSIRLTRCDFLIDVIRIFVNNSLRSARSQEDERWANSMTARKIYLGVEIPD